MFVGDMEAVPLEADLPDCLAATSEWHGLSTWRSYRCNWRILKDNLCHDLHAPLLHRNSPELMFQPIFRHASQISAVPLDDGSGIGYLARGGIYEADYPGLGHFAPRRESWYRLLSRSAAGGRSIRTPRPWQNTASNTASRRSCRSLRSIAWPSFGRSRRRAAAEDAVSRGLVAHQLSGLTQVRTHSTIGIAYATHHCG